MTDCPSFELDIDVVRHSLLSTCKWPSLRHVMQIDSRSEMMQELSCRAVIASYNVLVVRVRSLNR